MKIKLARGAAVFATVALTVAVSGCSGGNDTASGVTTVTWSQAKPEVVDYFNTLVKEFNEQNPDVKVVQQYDADQATKLAAASTRGNLPDIISSYSGPVLSQLVDAGATADLSKLSALPSISPAARQLVEDVIPNQDGQVNAVPFALSAVGVLYDKQVFADAGLTPPATWDQLMSTCAAFKAKGVVPAYGYNKAGAGGMIQVMNGLAAQLQPKDFWSRMRDGGPSSSVSFQKDYGEVAQKIVTFSEQCLQPDAANEDSNDATAAFAAGKAAMYVNGPWVEPVLKTANPNLDYAVMPFPATDSPDDRRVAALSDVTFVASKGKHQQAAEKFIDFMLQKSVVDDYLSSQGGAFSPLTDAGQVTSPAVAGLAQNMADGDYVAQPAVQFPASITYANYLETLVASKDTKAFLKTLDDDWARVNS